MNKLRSGRAAMLIAVGVLLLTSIIPVLLFYAIRPAESNGPTAPTPMPEAVGAEPVVTTLPLLLVLGLAPLLVLFCVRQMIRRRRDQAQSVLRNSTAETPQVNRSVVARIVNRLQREAPPETKSGAGR